jgi:hypothetical protein
MYLAESGRCSLDEPASRYLSWFNNPDDPRLAMITIRQLLTQTSGLSGTDDRLMLVAGKNPSLQYLASQSALLKLASDPGSAMSYSNWNYIVLGVLIEAISSQSYADYMESTVFPALGMPESRARLNKSNEEAFLQGRQWWFGFALPKADSFRPDILPAGYITSTLPDMERWLMANLSVYWESVPPLLSAESWRTLHTAPDGTKTEYAMGWGRRDTSAGTLLFHEGLAPTAFSAAYIHPQSGWALVLMTPVSALYTPKMASYLAQNVMNSLLGEPAIKHGLSFALWTLFSYVALIMVVLIGLLQFRGLNCWYRKLDTQNNIKTPTILLRLILSVASDAILPFIAFIFVPRGAGFPFWTAMFEWQPDLSALIVAFAGFMALIALSRLGLGLYRLLK